MAAKGRVGTRTAEWMSCPSIHRRERCRMFIGPAHVPGRCKQYSPRCSPRAQLTGALQEDIVRGGGQEVVEEAKGGVGQVHLRPVVIREQWHSGPVIAVKPWAASSWPGPASVPWTGISNNKLCRHVCPWLGKHKPSLPPRSPVQQAHRLIILKHVHPVVGAPLRGVEGHQTPAAVRLLRSGDGVEGGRARQGAATGMVAGSQSQPQPSCAVHTTRRVEQVCTHIPVARGSGRQSRAPRWARSRSGPACAAPGPTPRTAGRAVVGKASKRMVGYKPEFEHAQSGKQARS